jgi:sulfur-oxidizing protein SoxZ
MAVRTLIAVPSVVKRGEVFDVRATIAHPMETGHRADGAGGVVPRDALTRFECRLDGATVFRATLYPAIAANPFIAFTLRAERSGTLVFAWEGDRGFRHSESRALIVGA